MCSGKGRGMTQQRHVNKYIGRGTGLTQESQTSSGNRRGIGKGMFPQRQDYEDSGRGHTRPFKRSRMTGIKIYQAEDGLTTHNPGLSTKRVITTGAKVTKRSDVVPGDIGYKPR
ncbi:hypothetical protein BC332_13779 [Capsicum chinense]|nr:hypothetical protein BC332_13779 [Capsicum chinense]